MRRERLARILVPVAAFACWQGGVATAATREIVIRGPKVVTMDARHRILPHGRVLIAGDEIAAVWERGSRPAGLARDRVGAALQINADRHSLLFPGLINLHDHPSYSVLHAWPAPSSDAIPAVGKAGTDPYDNRYEWNTDSSDEYNRLVRNPEAALDDPEALDLGGEAIKYAEVKALLGGTTALQGSPRNAEADGVLIRNVDSGVFNDRQAPPRVAPIGSFSGVPLLAFKAAALAGSYDAWQVHLAEGVRDADRRPGDPVSSRAEFDALVAKGLLSDITVITHGTALERPDFAAMRAAPSPRADGSGDGLGAKLVWSPRSNLQLYGETTDVYEALAEDVLVSLGTDWTPSGSANLLGELKVADRALRDRRVLGGDRHLVPELGSERRLDRTLVDMVTRNPARTLRWQRYVGSIEAGKRADLILIGRPSRRPPEGIPASPYRSLIDAGDRDVRMVLVDGQPLLASVARMARLKGSDYEVYRAGRFKRGIDTTEPGVPGGDERLGQFRRKLRQALAALGGDQPPPAGGPAPSANTYSYLKARWSHGSFAASGDAAFRSELQDFFGLDSSGRLNIEALQLKPLIDGHDDFLGHLLDGDVAPGTRLIDDPTPPFRLYPANFNHIGPRGNPLAGLP